MRFCLGIHYQGSMHLVCTGPAHGCGRADCSATRNTEHSAFPSSREHQLLVLQNRVSWCPSLLDPWGAEGPGPWTGNASRGALEPWLPATQDVRTQELTEQSVQGRPLALALTSPVCVQSLRPWVSQWGGPLGQWWRGQAWPLPHTHPAQTPSLHYTSTHCRNLKTTKRS